MNARQELFVAEYLVDRNATKAAVRAGYAERTAKQTGWRLLQIPSVAAAVAREDLERQERLRVDADSIIGRLMAVHDKAFYGSPKVSRDGVPIEVDGERVREWAPASAIRALEVVAKMLGVAGSERHEVDMRGGPVVYTLTLDRELPTDVEED